jgi:uncharacterized protein YdhG (YjbR/CyaY superfamily)
LGYDKGPSLSGARIEDADFSGARLHAPNFEGAKITDAWFSGADISGDLEGLRLNGVEVAPLVTAELDRMYPERAKLRAAERDGLSDAWDMIEDVWQATLVRARALPPQSLSVRVDDEWSFVETLRHLVLATDCWLRRMIKGLDRPYHPWGLAGSWLTDPAGWGLDPAANPSLDEVLEVRRERMGEVKQTIAAATPEELERVCVPPATPGHPTRPHSVLACLHVILNEEWEHHRYAARDLGSFDTRSERSDAMPTTGAKTQSGGFSADERAAMKARVAELRAEGKQGAKKADGLQAVLDAIAKMAPADQALAERVHAAVTATAPQLSPKTWYGMPAYANADGKVVIYFRDAGKFNERYSNLGFQDLANLDDGDMWPIMFAVRKWSPTVEKKVIQLVKTALS